MCQCLLRYALRATASSQITDVVEGCIDFDRMGIAGADSMSVEIDFKILEPYERPQGQSFVQMLCENATEGYDLYLQPILALPIVEPHKISPTAGVCILSTKV